MPPPELLDGVVAVLGDDDGPLGVVGPHHHVLALREVAHDGVVAVGEELVVQDAVGELKPGERTRNDALSNWLFRMGQIQY